MSSNTRTTIARTKRYTVNQLPDETGSGLRKFELVIDKAITVTLIENGPNALVVNAVTADENTVASHPEASFLALATDISIPDSAIDMLESETGMRFEGTTTLRNPITESMTDSSDTDSFMLADAM